MHDPITQSDVQDLMQVQSAHAVSLYMPANQVTTETQKDTIGFKNLVSEAQEALIQRGMRRPDALELLKPATELLKDADFWRHQSHGLAVFIAPEMEPRIYRLPLRVSHHCQVSNRFFVKPLLRLISQEEGYFVLALSQNDVRFFRGNRDGLEQETIANLPTDIQEALGEWQPERELQFHTGTGATGDGGRQAAMFHGHAGSDVQMKDELLRFFRHIADALHPTLRAEKAPLLLAAVDYLHPLYAEANGYAHLLDDGIDGNPDEMQVHELQAAAWKRMEPIFVEKRNTDLEEFAQLAGTGRTGLHVDEVAIAAFQGRIETVFLPQEVRVWGVFDQELGKVVAQSEPLRLAPGGGTQQTASASNSDPTDEATEDLLDFIALHTFMHGGKVHVVDAEEIPGTQTVAAIYRF